jgi:hypothetical protein
VYVSNIVAKGVGKVQYAPQMLLTTDGGITPRLNHKRGILPLQQADQRIVISSDHWRAGPGPSIMWIRPLCTYNFPQTRVYRKQFDVPVFSSLVTENQL